MNPGAMFLMIVCLYLAITEWTDGKWWEGGAFMVAGGLVLVRELVVAGMLKGMLGL